MERSPGIRFALLLAALFAAAMGSRAREGPPEKPKVRAITAFVRAARPHFREQIEEALLFLRKAKAAYQQAGYEVQTIRITTQPFPDYTRELSQQQTLEFFGEYNALAVKKGFGAAIGPAMRRDSDDPREAALLAKIIAATTTLEGSVIIAAEDGPHPKSIHAAAGVVKYLSEHTPRSQGNFNFAATAKVSPGTPFYPASYYAGAGREFAVGLQSANVVAAVLGSSRDPAEAQKALEESLGASARQIEAIGRNVAEETGWGYTGIDLSPAPLKDVSIGAAIERFTGARMGSSGTLAAAALITRALRAIRIRRIGYSGLMLPVLEDSVIARRWSEGALSVDALLAYSAVCGTGLDVVPLPGEITEEQIERILGDVASLAVQLDKPLSARLLPVQGKKAGERTEFDDPFLVNATLQRLP